MGANENVRRVRESRGVTKSFMARGLGLSLQGYSHIEEGNVRLDVERMKKIGDLLHVDSAIFLDDKLTDSAIKPA